MRAKETLPHGWAWADLGEVGTYLNGRAFKKEEWSKQGRPIIRIQDLTGTGTSPNYFEGEVDTRYEVSPGDLLVSWAATLGAYIWRGPAAVLNQHIFKVESHLNLHFHFYLLQAILAELQQQAHGTGMVHITKGKFDRTQIPVPPLGEQGPIVREIETHLTRLDAATLSLKRIEANLRRYRASVLKAACEGRIVPTEAEWARSEGRVRQACLPTDQSNRTDLTNLPEIPEGWEWAKLGDLLTSLRNGIATKPDAASGLPILRISAVRPLRIDLTDVRYLPFDDGRLDDFVLEEGDLLFTRYNGNQELVGVCAEVRNLGQRTVHPDKLIRGTVDRRSCLPGFLEIVLNVGVSRKILARKIRTTAGQSGISGSDLKALPVPVAPLPEQFRIVTEVQRQWSVIAQIESAVAANIARGDGLRKSILSHAFKGRLVPQDPNDEPASELLERIREVKASKRDGTREKRRKAAPAAPSTPPPPPAPTAKPAPRAEPEPEPAEIDFLDFPRDEQMEVVWDTLFGQGALEKDAAVRTAAEGLRDQGFAQFKRLRQDGTLYREIAAAIEKGVREGWLDRPRRGSVRAVRRDPKEYAIEDWQRCLLAVVEPESVDVDATLRAAAEWARETLGLEYARLREDGAVLTGLREALEETVREKRIIRRSGRVWRA